MFRLRSSGARLSFARTLRTAPRPMHFSSHARPKPPPPPPPPPKADLIAPQPSLYKRLHAAGSLSSATAPPIMTAAQRLLRPTLFTLLVVGGSLYYAYTWTPPAPSARWFPTVPLAFSTVATLIALNVGVFVAWRIPLPATWRILNRYFISVPAAPYAASMLGSAFSHQSLTHLGVNMAVLFVFGTSLCEQVGAGPFVALYVSGGVVSSLASLAWNVVALRFGVMSLGASGAIAALVGAYAFVNPEAELYVIFLPFVALKAKWLVALMAGTEVLGILRGWMVFDHVAHLGGLMWGVAGGWVIVREYRQRAKREWKLKDWRRRLGWR